MNCYNCSAVIDIKTLFCDKCGVPQQKLIEQISEGSQSAFESLYRYSYQNVYWAVRSMAALDEDTICDLIQNTYLKVYSSISQLKDVAALNGWIKRIAKNVTIDYLRKKEKSKVIFFSDLVSGDADVDEPDFEDESVETNPEISMEYQDRKRLINEILDELPPEQRVVLSMIFMQEMSTKEIAEELGISESTVKSRKAYGKKKVETSVKALEKKGVNLWGLTAVGFFTWLLKGIDADAAEIPDDSILERVSKQIEWNDDFSKNILQEEPFREDNSVKGNSMDRSPHSMRKPETKNMASSVKTAGKAVMKKKIITGIVIAVIVSLGAGTAFWSLKNSRSVDVVENLAQMELNSEVVAESESETDFAQTEMFFETAENVSETEQDEMLESSIEESGETETEIQGQSELQSEQVQEYERESGTEQIEEEKTKAETEAATEGITEFMMELISESAIQSDTEYIVESETEFETENVIEQVTEMESDSETELIIIIGEDLLNEGETNVYESEEESEDNTGSNETLASEEIILNTIQKLGYEYIGGQQYEVMYYGADPYSGKVGMAQEPPVGVAAYVVDDLDGDGNDELLLLLLEKADRTCYYDTSGLKDSQVVFIVCEEKDGEWVESQRIPETESVDNESNLKEIMTIADMLPCISTYLVPADTGKHIIIDNPYNGSFGADNLHEMIEIIYSEDSLSGNKYGFDETDYIIAGELSDQIESTDAELISRIYVDDFYDDQNELNYDNYIRLISNREDIFTTLILDVFH
ncbi:MAG: sigma-70 family RNA polymerase sigma factor [Lachnospiraceae bacterium]|nr:sigma-70 family RNA polymerase sigma factor [Lachnospiraceae bacterium]